MGKNIQMPEGFVTDVYRLILLLEDVDLDEGTRTLCRALESQLRAKLERMERHQLYTESKTGSDEQREQARRKYLDAAGIYKDWRY